MSQPASPSRPDNSATTDPTPPAEQFWKKYSPHFEFPLSSVGSIALHVAVFVGLFLLLRYVVTGEDKTPAKIQPVVIGDIGAVGDSDGGASGMLGGGTPQDRAEQFDEPEVPFVPEEVLMAARAELVEWIPDFKEAPDSVNDLAKTDAFRKFANQGKEWRDALGEGLGEQGGVGNANEPGVGDGAGGDNPNPGETARRMMRWTLNFRTTSGDDYLGQLAAMDAILWIPIPPEGPDNGWIIRDLENRDEREEGPINQFPMMSFYDDRRESVTEVARTLGLSFVPSRFYAFFPKEMENRLAELEKAYRNRKESEILSTTFSVVIRGGRPQIAVQSQVVAPRGR